MTLTKLIQQLKALEAKGYGNDLVFAIVGDSEAKFEVIDEPYVSNATTKDDPFNLNGLDFVCIKTGN